MKKLEVALDKSEIQWMINLLKDRLDESEADLGSQSEEDENDIEEGRRLIERLKGYL